MIGALETPQRTEVQVLLDDLSEKTQALYQHACRSLTPRRDWVLLRVLEREQVTKGGIIVPGFEQNKPLHEGIILATWEPWTEERTTRDEEGRTVVRVIHHRSELKAGDHVLFDHWAGVPVLSDSKINCNFRLVKEPDDPNLGSIKAVVEYSEKDERPHEIMTELLREMNIDVNSREFDQMCRLAAARIEDRFLLVDRDQQSITLSGR